MAAVVRLGLLPFVPFALHVVRVRHLPVRVARQGEAGNNAAGRHPHRVRHELRTDVFVPDGFGTGDPRGTLRVGAGPCARDALGPVQACVAAAPGGVGGQADRIARPARFFGHQRAAVDHASLEDVGLNAGALCRLTPCLRVPGVVFPGLCPVARVVIVAVFVVDVAERTAGLKHKRQGRPFEVACRGDLRMGLLPGEALSVGGGCRHGCQDGCRQDGEKQLYDTSTHDPNILHPRASVEGDFGRRGHEVGGGGVAEGAQALDEADHEVDKRFDAA